MIKTEGDAVTFMKSVKFALRYGPTSSLPLPSIYVEAVDQRRGGRERQRRSRHAAVGLPFFDFFKAFASRCSRAIRRPNPRRCARLREGRFVATRPLALDFCRHERRSPSRGRLDVIGVEHLDFDPVTSVEWLLDPLEKLAINARRRI